MPSLIDAEYQDRYYDKENFNGVTTKSADYFTVKKDFGVQLFLSTRKSSESNLRAS